MTPDQEKLCAAFILRLLLDDAAEVEKPDELSWEGLLDIARRNDVLLRVAGRLRRCGVRPPDFFNVAVEEERRLSREQLDAAARVGRACEENGIEFIFAKAFHHWPDMGDDLDLFVLGRSAEVDALVVAELRAAPVKRSLIDRLAAAASYRVPGCEAALDIHHGRTWAYGEHDSFIATLIKNARRVRVEGTEVLIPSPEDLLVMQGTQRVYGRVRIRLASVVHTISSLRRGGLDWGYIVGTARRFGALLGVSCYLSYVDQIHREVFASDLLPADVKKSLVTRGWGRVEFRGGAYRFPHFRVARKVYLNMLGAALLSGNWQSLSRLCVAPLVAATVVLKRSVSQSTAR